MLHRQTVGRTNGPSRILSTRLNRFFFLYELTITGDDVDGDKTAALKKILQADSGVLEQFVNEKEKEATAQLKAEDSKMANKLNTLESEITAVKKSSYL